MTDSTKKRIVLTGVSRGLGRKMTDLFIQLGHTVCGCARSNDMIKELQQQYPEPHSFHQVDVSDDQSVAAWAKEVLAQGPVDLLLNNAALMNEYNTLWEVPVEEFSQVIDVNIKGVANVIRHFVPSMIARKAGVIVNWSSTWGRSVSPNVAPYCATKWAIEGLTAALAKELPKGVIAASFNPGVVNTEMLQTIFGAAAGASPSPDDYAQRAVPYLLEISKKDNGKQLTVPGY